MRDMFYRGRNGTNECVFGWYASEAHCWDVGARSGPMNLVVGDGSGSRSERLTGPMAGRVPVPAERNTLESLQEKDVRATEEKGPAHHEVS